MKSRARCTAFARERIVGKAGEGASRANIRKHVLKRDGKKAGVRAVAHILGHTRTSFAVSLFHYCSSMGFVIQTLAFYCTDVDIAIQTVIQTHAFYGTDVQTVK